MSLLRLLGDSHLLFSERDQAVYELDELSADVWNAIDRGADADAIISEIVAGGADPQSAHAAVQERMARLGPYWTGTASLMVDAPAAEDDAATVIGTVAEESVLTLEIGGVTVAVDLDAGLREEVLETFLHLTAQRAAVDARIRAHLVGEDVELAGRGGLTRCRRAEFLPALKMEMLAAVLACARYELALHGGAFVRDDRVMFVAGSPGAGKTTLGIALSHNGWEVDADDVTLMHGDGRVSGIPFPFAAKSGSWPLISHFFPDGLAERVHRRPDGQQVRFIAPRKLAAARPRPIGAIVLLNRSASGDTRIEEIDRALAFKTLLAEADSRDHRLSTAGFSAMISALREARCVKLSYCDFVEASQALGDLRW